MHFEVPEYSDMGPDSLNMLSQVAQTTIYKNTTNSYNARSSSVKTWKKWVAEGGLG